MHEQNNNLAIIGVSAHNASWNLIPLSKDLRINKETCYKCKGEQQEN